MRWWSIVKDDFVTSEGVVKIGFMKEGEKTLP